MSEIPNIISMNDLEWQEEHYRAGEFERGCYIPRLKPVGFAPLSNSPAL
jgi:hypothetical protein